MKSPLSRKTEMNDEWSEIRGYFDTHEGLKIELLGSGKAEFLYIRSSERAAEVSIAEQGFFVELWDVVDEESNKAPVSSEIMPSIPEVLIRLTEWFSPDTDRKI
jgi:hypothetical protein